MLVIRKALAADASAVKAIEKACALSPWSLEDYASEPIRQDATFLLAESGGIPVGFLLARLITIANHAAPTLPIHYEIQIHNIAVLPPFRRRGIAGKLLGAALKMIPPRCPFEMILEVRTTNTNARAFYEKHGFVVAGTRRGFYSNPPEDAFVMRLSKASD